MSVPGRFWVPGPVEVDPDVQAAMLRPVIGHRTRAGHLLAERIQRGLKRMFGIDRPVIVATCSATGLMESAIRSGVRERLLAVVSGTFGERFARIAERCGKEVVRLHVPRGTSLEPAQLESMLDGPPVDAVSLVHVETSTGALAPVAELIPLFRRLGDVVTIVDAVGSFGGMPVTPEEWDADFVIAASQKAMALPPGLAFAVASDRFLSRALGIDDRGLYLDAIALHHAADDGRFPQTPVLPVLHALDRQLERIIEGGIDGRFERHRLMRERVEHWAMHQSNLSIIAPRGRRSDTVTALRLPEQTSSAAVIGLLDDAGYQVASGLDQDLPGVIRIGHMGDGSLDQLSQLLATLDAVV
ncbi:MAG TPA: aminotransferase class V-fold PLP-dependent enzyme [Gemmatimonadales bacterium]|nr:aminotransferase class V-fold PLP-dependent enzyme [Gemmatimonadales bacterium]